MKLGGFLQLSVLKWKKKTKQKKHIHLMKKNKTGKRDHPGCFKVQSSTEVSVTVSHFCVTQGTLLENIKATSQLVCAG